METDPKLTCTIPEKWAFWWAFTQQTWGRWGIWIGLQTQDWSVDSSCFERALKTACHKYTSSWRQSSRVVSIVALQQEDSEGLSLHVLWCLSGFLMGLLVSPLTSTYPRLKIWRQFKCFSEAVLCFSSKRSTPKRFAWPFFMRDHPVLHQQSKDFLSTCSFYAVISANLQPLAPLLNYSEYCTSIAWPLQRTPSFLLLPSLV